MSQFNGSTLTNIKTHYVNFGQYEKRKPLFYVKSKRNFFPIENKIFIVNVDPNYDPKYNFNRTRVNNMCAPMNKISGRQIFPSRGGAMIRNDSSPCVLSKIDGEKFKEKYRNRS
jgi:hypothetical protein